jgi:hypothetical protein
MTRHVSPILQGVRRLAINETIQMDWLGPVIITEDGQTRLIANWDELSSAEKETTWKRIGELLCERQSSRRSP